MSHLKAIDFSASLLEQIRAAVSPECFRTWFKDLAVVSTENGTLRIAAGNRYVKHWLETHYSRELLAAAAALQPDLQKVEITVKLPAIPEAARSLGDTLESALPRTPHAAHASNGHLPRVSGHGSASRHDSVWPSSPLHLHLEALVVGKGNRLAHAAAQSVAESPAAVYNPLYIHGAQGLGKTHVLQGIGNLLLERAPLTRIVHISCEEFTNAYVTAVQTRHLDAFRAHFRGCDVLLLDDVQFLAGREKTQEEFLHTFDALRNTRKQIVLCANCAPREIKRLDERLVTRFQSGLVARLDAPDAAQRMEILRAKARHRSMQLAPEAAEVLAAHIQSNIRELEGAVCKLMALAAAESRAPDRELALLALRELGYLRSGPLQLADVLAAVAQRAAVNPDEIRGGKRHASLVRVRHIAMYLSSQICSQSIAEVGRFYGNRDHATVLHANRKIGELLKHDEELRQELQHLRQLLGR